MRRCICPSCTLLVARERQLVVKRVLGTLVLMIAASHAIGALVALLLWAVA